MNPGMVTLTDLTLTGWLNGKQKRPGSARTNFAGNIWKTAQNDPARKIIDFISDYNIDMVVMCRKGESGEFNMGGTAQKVIEYSPVPVVITPGP
ncbi:MAG: universal stress protein [Deltaproteobacteria bacterium]|nr:universal stress protein [Deltaproteobacteria bacterium]